MEIHVSSKQSSLCRSPVITTVAIIEAACAGDLY